jgi:hypothetical protein
LKRAVGGISRHLLLGEPFTQPARDEKVLTEADILETSEALRRRMDYFAHAPLTMVTLLRLALPALKRGPN